MSRKGTCTMVIGIVLMVFQLISFIGNVRSDEYFLQNFMRYFESSFESWEVFMYGMATLLGYFSIGIIGLVLFIIGFIKYRKS